MKNRTRALLGIVVLLPLVVSAEGPPREVVEDFSTSRAAAGSTAVFNIASKKIHLPLVVDRGAGDPSFTPTGAENDSVPLGDGSDGAFNPDTSPNFDSDRATPNTITLVTSRVYQFTTFRLDAGYTIRPVGTDPLRIRVQSTAQIDGVINLSGGNGAAGVDGGGTASPAGGSSCCGGGAGGRGGANGSPAEAGGSPATTTGGGNPGGATSDTSPSLAGGGGGGAHVASGVNGSAGSGAFPGTLGTGGTLYGDAYASALLGGSGGGGGGGHPGYLDTGGGGGGGGGVLLLTAGGDVTLTATGQIRADGGNGGGGSGLVAAGSGGGGSGGAIVLFSGGNIDNGGLLIALAGTGGSGSLGGNGGNGQNGRLRYTDVNGAASGSGTENPPFSAATFGQVYFARNADYVVTSTAIDSGNSGPKFISVEKEEVLPTGTSISYEYAGSLDNFVSDDTGFKPEAQLAALNGRRYFKYRVTLRSTDANKTPELKRLTFKLEDRVQPEFSFGLASCARVHPGGAGSPLGSLILLGFLALLPIAFRKTKRN